MVPKILTFMAFLFLLGCQTPGTDAKLASIEGKLDALTVQQASRAPTGCFYLQAAGAGEAPGLYTVQMLCPEGKPLIELVPLIKQAAPAAVPKK